MNILNNLDIVDQIINDIWWRAFMGVSDSNVSVVSIWDVSYEK